MHGMDAIYFSAPLTLDAPAGDELPRNFKGIAYSGERVPGYNMVIDLASAKIEQRMPLLLQHDHSIIIGNINETGNSQTGLTVAGELFSDFDAAAKDVALKAKRGVQYQMSVGAFNANAEFIPAGKGIVVNGREFSGPIDVLRDAHIRETSIVALGADSKARADIFSHQGGNAMTIEQLQARVAELEAANATLAGERDALKSENDTLKAASEQAVKDARLSEVKKLFADTGRTFSDEAAKPYLSLSVEAFGAISKDMRDAKPANPKLFSEQATGGGADNKGDAAKLSVTDIFAARRKAAGK